MARSQRGRSSSAPEFHEGRIYSCPSVCRCYPYCQHSCAQPSARSEGAPASDGGTSPRGNDAKPRPRGNKARKKRRGAKRPPARPERRGRRGREQRAREPGAIVRPSVALCAQPTRARFFAPECFCAQPSARSLRGRDLSRPSVLCACGFFRVPVRVCMRASAREFVCNACGNSTCGRSELEIRRQFY